MSKPKLIKIENMHIKCDNPNCDYHIDDVSIELKDLKEYVNKPCPKCGRNLLTERNYNDYKNMYNIINFVNKYFSWTLRIFKRHD